MIDSNRFSIGYVVGAIAATFTIIVSVLLLWDRFFLVEANASDALAIPQMTTPNEMSDLETLLASQLNSSLRSYRCSEVELIDVEATEKLTSSGQTTSGFTGYFLEGKAELESGGNILQIRIAGNGKGPAAQSNALAMASENFMAKIVNDSSFSTYCENQ